MLDFVGTLTIDEMNVSIDGALATYEIEASWTDFSYLGRPQLVRASARLKQWMSGDRVQSREIAVSLAGEEWVRAQEEQACEQWARLAEAAAR